MKQKQKELMTRRKIFLKMWYYIKRHQLTKSKALKKAWNVHKGNDKSTGILEVWNGKRLKNVGKPNQHHYRNPTRDWNMTRDFVTYHRAKEYAVC